MFTVSRDLCTSVFCNVQVKVLVYVVRLYGPSHRWHLIIYVMARGEDNLLAQRKANFRIDFFIRGVYKLTSMIGAATGQLS